MFTSVGSLSLPTVLVSEPLRMNRRGRWSNSPLLIMVRHSQSRLWYVFQFASSTNGFWLIGTQNSAAPSTPYLGLYPGYVGVDGSFSYAYVAGATSESELFCFLVRSLFTDIFQMRQIHPLWMTRVAADPVRRPCGCSILPHSRWALAIGSTQMDVRRFSYPSQQDSDWSVFIS